MRILTVPNWSFGRDRALLRNVRDALDERGLKVHFCESDVDHNRTVTAFSGELPAVRDALIGLSDLILPCINLNHHAGCHPRIGGLDVCPFVALPEVGETVDAEAINAWVDDIASAFAERFEVPVFLYEKSEKGRHEADLPSLRRGGFGGLWERELNPDFGPKHYHPLLGVTIMGLRDFLLAFNVNLKPEDRRAVVGMARQIRDLRREGDPRFLGVRAMGFDLPTREISQVSINLTLPDLTTVDPIVEFVRTESSKHGLVLAGAELIGPIRQADLPGATYLPVSSSQVVQVSNVSSNPPSAAS